MLPQISVSIFNSLLNDSLLEFQKNLHRLRYCVKGTDMRHNLLLVLLTRVLSESTNYPPLRSLLLDNVRQSVTQKMRIEERSQPIIS